MKKITEITTEREFISKLRTYYRKARRKGYLRNEISFLGLMEYTGCATREFEYQSDKYFSVGIRAYDWVHGNSLLSELIDKWENEIEAEKRKKQPAQPTEVPQISTETAETVNVSAEGENAAERAENKPTSADVARMVKTELAKNKAMRTTWKLEFPDGTECNTSHKCTVAGCDFYEYTETRNGEEAFKDYKATERDITLYICQRLEFDALEPPQSPETPQAVECTTDSDCRVCSHCGKHFHEGYFLGDEYACSEECAVALYGGDRELFEADLEAEEEEAGATECYWTTW